MVKRRGKDERTAKRVLTEKISERRRRSQIKRNHFDHEGGSHRNGV